MGSTRTLLALSISALLLAACGSDASDSADDTSSEAPMETTEEEQQQPAEGATEENEGDATTEGQEPQVDLKGSVTTQDGGFISYPDVLTIRFESAEEVTDEVVEPDAGFDTGEQYREMLNGTGFEQPQAILGRMTVENAGQRHGGRGTDSGDRQ